MSELHQSRPSYAWALTGLWFGVLCGFLEGFLQLSLQSLVDSKYVSIHILWVAPCLYGVVFSILGAVGGAVLGRLWPGRADQVLLLMFVILTVVVPLNILLQGYAATYAILVLSLGLAVALWRWLLQHREAVLTISTGSSVRLGLLAVVAAVLIPLVVHAREALATRALQTSLPEPPNIIIVVLDALRADHLSTLGYPRETSPFITRLAEQGVMYEKAYATSPWSLPSHVSLLTGNGYELHHVDWYNHQGMRDYQEPVLPEVLRENGYRTGAFSANMFWVTHDRMGRGFLHFDDFFYNATDAVLRTMYGRALEAMLLQKIGFEDIPARRLAEDINQSLLKWVDREPGQPFFALLNYMDVHDPYLPPEPFRSRFSPAARESGTINWRVGRTEPELDADMLASEVAAYDGGIAYLDYQLEQLVGALQERGIAGNTLLVITSDHGESFGEHDLLLHGHSLYHEQLHVPLLISWPGHVPPGLRPVDPVSNASIPSTVLDLVGIENPMTKAAPSLADWQRSATPYIPVTAHVEQTPWVPEDSPAYTGMVGSIIRDSWQLILHEHDQPQLFNMQDDPEQINNLSGQQNLQALESDLTTLLLENTALPAR